MAKPELVAFTERQGAETAMLFIHGFGGNAKTTWGQFPAFIAQQKALDKWNLYSLGYSTSLAPDIRGIWAADPPIDSLANYLREADWEEKKATRKIAAELLEHCAKSKRTYWCAATEGEAQFYLGDTAAGLETYREAVAMNPSPRELESMYSQANLVLALLEDKPAQKELKVIFKGIVE